MSDALTHLALADLTLGLAHIQGSPKTEGTLAVIVRRPTVEAREVVTTGTLSLTEGLQGDSWKDRPSTRTPDQTPHPDMQLTLMNSRVIALIAGAPERWPLAGDQLYVDLDLSEANLPPGTVLSLGEAQVLITAQPHTGCAKFSARFGSEALKWVNSPEGRALRLRGVNARVIRAGRIQVGERITVQQPG